MASGFPLWAAIRTVKDKIGTWQGFTKYSELDPSITRESWAAAIGQARAALAQRIQEATLPLNRRPTDSEITPYDSKRATGYLQTSIVYVRDPDTGLIEEKHFTVRGDTLRSRQAIVDFALQRLSDIQQTDPDSVSGEIVGVEYTGTFLMRPKP